MSSDLETRQVYLFCLIWTRNTFAQNKWFYIVMLSALRDSFFLVPEIVSHLWVIFTNWIMLVQRGGIGRPMGIVEAHGHGRRMWKLLWRRARASSAVTMWWWMEGGAKEQVETTQVGDEDAPSQCQVPTMPNFCSRQNYTNSY